MIVFVAGIHGAGKTYLGAPAAKNLGLRHATASELISEERGLQTWGADKRVKTVEENQAALIAATRRLHLKGEKLLLDGHFVLRGANGEINEIETSVFDDLQIGAVILLDVNVNIVFERLWARGDQSWTKSELRQLAQREKVRARQVISELGIPFRYLDDPDLDGFTSSLRELVQS